MLCQFFSHAYVGPAKMNPSKQKPLPQFYGYRGFTSYTIIHCQTPTHFIEMASLSSTSSIISVRFRNPRTPSRFSDSPHVIVLSKLLDSSKPTLRVSSDSSPKARFVARRTESVAVNQFQRPLIEYMSLPASQYSVLDAERIERVDDNTFRCYVYRFKFFTVEVCPVLLVRVEEQPHGCCIKLLSCKLEGSRMVVAQNDKFDGANVGNKSSVISGGAIKENMSVMQANVIGSEHGTPSGLQAFKCRLILNINIILFRTTLTLIWYGHAASMENKISCDSTRDDSPVQKLTSDAVIEVSIEVPFAFRVIPTQAIESAGSQVLDQILKAMLPKFLFQLVKDYEAWASGDTSRQPLGTGEI
ncbi:hypothetical protein STAS_22705 [Striga asiatica]|uniref:Uncharacterized protein n=1 Tax=Striga asiatica TaxID=4170 RepID=A0A5A7QP98_STRAF|nr:hypothetical protein STAS_22705 [Striga asiatica]